MQASRVLVYIQHLLVYVSNDRRGFVSGSPASAEAAARSYYLPTGFPFPSARLVMETEPGTCDLYADPLFCVGFSAGRLFEPERHTREVIASFLIGCHLRTCHAIDLGANNGWFTTYMLALGAYVTAVEPQTDFAKALEETIELNGWAHRGRVVNAYVDANPTSSGYRPVHEHFRAGNYADRTEDDRVLPDAPVIPLDQILVDASGINEFEFIKMDADYPEGDWLRRVAVLLSKGRVRIKTLVVECNGCDAPLLFTLQRLCGYDVYMLDMHMDHRFLDARGIDVYSSFEPTVLPPFVYEMFSIRLMRHLYYFKRNMSWNDWFLATKVRRFSNMPQQFVFTKEQLLEPRYEHRLAKEHPSQHRIRSKYNAAPDGGVDMSSAVHFSAGTFHGIWPDWAGLASKSI